MTKARGSGSAKNSDKSKSKTKTPSSRRKKPTPSSQTAADVVDQQLERYRSMRDFGITAEPGGSERSSPTRGLAFCVQKHAASHLHYDFRLAWNGVLKSWAVAKGPSYFTGDKRLAVQVEDHPIEYGGFEGIIPKAQYGGGTVMLWDQGTWEPQKAYPDVDAGLRDGSLKFVLHGTKLEGKWALIRMKGKAAGSSSKPNWLLIKEHDEFERNEGDPSITEAEQNSVITGRTMDEIAHNEDHVWNSKQTNSGTQPWKRQSSKPTTPSKKKMASASARQAISKLLTGLPDEQQPGFLSPELATMAEVPPSGSGWLHELKLDGYRIQAHKSGDNVRMYTRTGLDWTHRMKPVADAVANLPIENAILDGELVVVAENGTTNFADLQASMQEGGKHNLTYFAFDLLHIEGKGTRNLALEKRKQILAAVLSASENEQVRLSEHIETGGEEMLREACKLQAEGIISKRADSTYSSGRTRDWIKTKCLHEQEFVVGGYTLPTNGIRGVGALLLGYYRDGKLIYAGRTGTGFTQKTHRFLRDRVESLAKPSSPFEKVPAEAQKGAYWIKPELVAQVRFATWTADDLVRQAAFLGVREDKAAKEVVREEAESSIGPRSNRRRTTAKQSSQPFSSEAKTLHADHAPVRLTHPSKVLDGESGLTKQMLADYYWEIADRMLEYIRDRPVSLVRCPDGVGKGIFFQKHVNATLPGSIGSVAVPDKKTGKIEQYITVSSQEGLASLAQIGVLELHPWGSKNGDLERPDQLIFDLDPDEDLGWSDVRLAAEEMRKRLDRINLKSFVKTTGGKGLHVVVPIKPRLLWLEAKEFSYRLVSEMERDTPQRFLTKMTKAARKGKIYLDYLRNERGATSVAAYSPRARSGVAVSMPLSWSELKKTTTRPTFRVVDFGDWRSRLKVDPWKEISSLEQELSI